MHHKRVVYPFTAIVGQDKMKKSLILNAIDWKIGGVLIRGEKGTAKSTAVRALADLLPWIEVVADCPFNCNPHDLKEMCKSCQERMKEGEKLPIRKKKMSVIDLPINATEDRVAGALNIERALKEGIKALEPGILANANRGVLYIDEVNLLDDHISDLLLDAAAMEVNVVEREGISIYHPAKFILVGTMNPEEGELRPQLLDRFGHSVRVEKISNLEQRKEIIMLREEFDSDPWKFAKRFEEKQRSLRNKIKGASKLLPQVIISDDLLTRVVKVCVEFAVDGHRADIITAKTAKAIAAFNGRKKVNEDDVLESLELTLEHRMRRKPFEKPEVDFEKLKQVFQEKSRENKKTEENKNQEGGKDSMPDLSKEGVFNIGGGIKTDDVFLTRRDRTYRRSMGRSSKTLTKSKDGKYVRAKMPRGKVNDIAIDATLRSAVSNRTTGGNIIIKTENIREKVRSGKSASLVVFVVDASGSMGVMERMKATKGAILSLLNTSYQKRDRVAMIAFRDKEAYLVLSPTRSTHMALKHLQELPTGGKTPLPAGIVKGIDVIKSELIKNDNLIPIMVLLTDGKGNVPIGKNVLEDLQNCALEIKKKGINVVIIDTEAGQSRLGMAEEFARVCNAKYHHIENLKPDYMASIIKSDIEGRI